MTVPGITFYALAAMDPCGLAKRRELFRDAPNEPLTAAVARERGASLRDVLWITSRVALTNPDVKRRLLLFAADCAAHVLPIFLQTFPSDDRPRAAIVAARAAGAAGAAGATEATEAAWAAAWSAWSAGAAGAAGAAEAAGAAAEAAWSARAAEKEWQFDRLCAWLSEEEPQDWEV